MSFIVNNRTYSQTHDVNGGKISPAIFPDGYPTPYPIKFAGLFLKTALSTAYDAAATPTYPVAVPCGNGERPDAFAFKTTANTALWGAQELFNGADYFLPKVVDRTGGSSAYTQDKYKFVDITAHPFIPGQVIGVPVAATTLIVVGDYIASANDGFAEVATTGDIVVGKAETIADNSTGAAGAKIVWIKVGHQYTSA